MHDHSMSRISGLRLRNARLVKRAGTFALVFLVAVFALVYVWERVQVIRLGYEIEDLKKQKDGLLKTNKGLLIEAATLTSPDRIEAVAVKDIGMKTPTDSQVVMVKRMAKGRTGGVDDTRHVERTKPGQGKS